MSKILVVEDSKSPRKMITNLLQDNQFKVVTARNGLEALAKVKMQHSGSSNSRYHNA